MANAYSERLQKLMKSFTKLPGIGPKSAERIVLHLLKQDRAQVEELVRLLSEAKTNTFFCERCFNLSEARQCHICLDESRSSKQILVVEDPKDVAAFEKAGVYKGLYHVLLGHLSPQDGVGPEDIRLKELLDRIDSRRVEELILATSARTEGEATALYISELLEGHPIKVTRIARGIPVGHPLEFADQATLARAFQGRQSLSKQ